jgi:hypothetical protein
MSRLPSFRNDEGQIIRVHRGNNGFRAFVHRGGTEEWGPTSRHIQELHDDVVEYMENNP